jgi:hypothetical protein
MISDECVHCISTHADLVLKSKVVALIDTDTNQP